MNKFYYLVLFIQVFGNIIFPQNNTKINPNFYNTWVEENYYTKILNCKSPVELNSEDNRIIEIHFFRTPQKILFTSFTEGMKQAYTIINKDSIITIAPNKSKSIIYLAGTKLISDNGNETKQFVPLDKKYYSPNGISYLINDKFFTGNYFTKSDSTIKISFTTNGKVKGMEPFNSYSIPIKRIPLPTNFDLILLQEIDKKIKHSKLLHWKKNGNEIILYNISNLIDSKGNYTNSKILDKYLTLIKDR